MADVAAMILEDTLTALEDEVIPALDAALIDCASLIEQWRLSEVRRAVEMLEGLKAYLEDRIGEDNG
jgi:hypothetical protein